MPDPITAAGVYVPQGPTGDEERRRLAGKKPIEIAREFEAVLLAQVIGAMRRTVPDSDMLEASANRKMLDGAFDHEVARSLAAKGGLGIAEQLVGQIEREQAARQAAAGAGPAQVASARSEPATPAARPLPAIATHAVDGTVLPVAGEISSPFGVRADPFTGAPRFHAGVDVAAPRGTAIRAVADGEVVFSGWRRGGTGRVVEVRHADGLVTSYAHAERTLVRAGQHVVAGEVVATVGSSGRASGPHLHFAATRDGQPIDPAEILDARHALAAAPDAI